MVMWVQTHRGHSITRIVFDEAFAPLKWEPLTSNQIIGEIPVLIGFVIELVAGWRSQMERIFTWMQDIDLASPLSRVW